MRKKGQARNNAGEQLRDIILGGQDGVVNVLGLVLGVAAATNDTRIIIIAGLASTFAESISMGAVAYTSSKAAHDYYLSEVAHEKQEILKQPTQARKEIKTIYYQKGFRGRALDLIVKKLTSSRKQWLATLLNEELQLSPSEYSKPLKIALVVGFSSLIGSLIPLIPFFFTTVKTGVILSLVSCLATLFITGAVKAKLTVGDWKRSGLEIALIGTVAALIGYGIGKLLTNVPL